LNIEYVRPEQIEHRSFEIIEAELISKGIVLSKDRDYIIKRAIHTTADFEYAQSLYFSDGAVETALGLIKGGASIVTDTNMAMSGINKGVLSSYGGNVYCYMADKDIMDKAKNEDSTRASAAMEKAAGLSGPVIFAIGNAPTALLKLRQMYDEGLYKPAFIIGVPVGFVNVEAAKELIIDTDIPCIINRGRKGGSNVAAAICNALLYHLRDNG
jgi:precorrin-8X/cobalt-precorrin-8 methylmutase